MAGFSDILKQLERDSRSRLTAKIPAWAKVDGITVPSTLSLEQCSSEATARHKSALMAALAGESEKPAVADLTGGLGVDSWAFGSIASKLWYNEMNVELAEAVKENFRLLGVDCAEYHNFLIDNTMEDWAESLEAFGPNIIFLDPARRSATGRKVFLPEDCSPDFLTLLPRLLSIAKHVVVKLSPMADITMLRTRISSGLKQVRVVGYGGECKELLCVVERGYTGDCQVIAEIIDRDFSLICKGGASFVETVDVPREGMWVFEPHPALIKADGHNLWAAENGYAKADRFTHVYFSAEAPQEAAVKGSARRIEQVMELNKSCIRTLKGAFPLSDVTARGLRMTSDELASRLGCKGGNERHIFGIGTKNGNFLLITK